ncbi:hypothetical protein D9M68_558810 [compost metagenome]
MADDLAAFLDHERQRELIGRAQGVDDEVFGAVGMRCLGKRRHRQLPDGGLVARLLGANHRPRLRPPRSLHLLLRVGIHQRPHGAKQRPAAGVLLAVAEVEFVVEVRRVRALVVLQQGLELVERLHRLRFGRLGFLVLVPQCEDARAQRRVERAREHLQVFALLRALVGMRGLLDGGDVAVDRLAQVVHHAHLQHLEQVQVGQLVLEGHGHQAQAPAVLGRALGAARGRVRAAQHALEALGLAKEVQPSLDLIDVHLAVSFVLNMSGRA